MKSLLIADLLIIIAFFALSQPRTEIDINLTESEYVNATLDKKQSDIGIRINYYNTVRYFDDETSYMIRKEFFDYCATKERKCRVEIKRIDEQIVLNWK